LAADEHRPATGARGHDLLSDPRLIFVKNDRVARPPLGALLGHSHVVRHRRMIARYAVGLPDAAIG